MTDEARSERPCPVCGEHRLALVGFPEVNVVGYQPASEIMGMGELRARAAPAIACLACGTEWTDLEAFRAAEEAADAVAERRRARQERRGDEGAPAGDAR